MKHRQELSNCIGCGLCESVFGKNHSSVELNESGFYSPSFKLSKEECKTLKKFCPCDVVQDTFADNVWGQYKEVYLGYSTDETERYHASSGGIITAVAGMLLSERMVDAVLQIGEGNNPFFPELHMNTTIKEVKQCSGSRYIAVKPFSSLIQILDENKTKRFAVVGRPCDIRGIRALSNLYPQVKEQILFLFSFFCAGCPSVNATKKMASTFGVESNDVALVKYRGNGWPGFATVTTKKNVEFKMDYESSWGKILGRDIYRGCRLCADGIGIEADISCGDAWYLDENGKVSFEDRPGRNVIFCRSKIGSELIALAQRKGIIHTEKFNIAELDAMQPYQSIRKAQLRYKLLALKTVAAPRPNIHIGSLKKYSRGISYKEKIRMYLGTVKRVLMRKM